jgi:response regulator NasT
LCCIAQFEAAIGLAIPYAWGMRVLVVDASSARSALLTEGLAGFDSLEVRQAAAFDAAEAARFQPDLILMASDRPDQEAIERLRAATEATPRPVVMFVERSEPALAEAAMQAGVSAYVVDGLSKARVRPVVEVAMSRFRHMEQLRQDLEKARAELASRKVVERAKALLMKQRGLEEAAAYELLRKLSMDSGRPLGAVAADLLAFASVLKGDES